MRIVRARDVSPEPTSHDPDLLKTVLLGPEALPGLRQFARIVFPRGATATAHVHAEAYEVFLCTRGEIVFSVGDSATTLGAGDCLAVEPGERHGVTDTREEAELVYFLLPA